MEWIMAFAIIGLIVGLLIKFAYDHRKEEEHLEELQARVDERRASAQHLPEWRSGVGPIDTSQAHMHEGRHR